MLSYFPLTYPMVAGDYVIKTDGTLWVRVKTGLVTLDPDDNFEQVGTDTDWKLISGIGATFAVKTNNAIYSLPAVTLVVAAGATNWVAVDTPGRIADDGTLWDGTGQVGTDTDWVGWVATGGAAYGRAQKADGSIYTIDAGTATLWPYEGYDTTYGAYVSYYLDSAGQVMQYTGGVETIFAGGVWVKVSGGDNSSGMTFDANGTVNRFFTGLMADGTVAVWEAKEELFLTAGAVVVSGPTSVGSISNATDIAAGFPHYIVDSDAIYGMGIGNWEEGQPAAFVTEGDFVNDRIDHYLSTPQLLFLEPTPPGGGGGDPPGGGGLTEHFPILITDNRFNDGTPVASGTAAGYDARFLADERPFTFWQAPAVGTYTIKVNCGSAQIADTLALCGHNFASIGALVSVESSPDDAVWTERLAPFTPANDYALMRLFTGVSALWWRLTIAAPAGVPRCAIAFIGSRLTFPITCDSPYVPADQDVEEDSPLSEGGYPLGTAIKFKPLRTRPSFSNLPRAFVFDTFRPIWENYLSDRRTFFWAWDLATYPNDFIYLARHEGKYNPGVSILTLADRLDLDLRCWR